MTDRAPSQQIADALRAEISAGRLSPGQRVPAVRDLAERYKVSRTTASRALMLLKGEGVIVTRHGSGSYVRESHPIRRLGPDRYARHRWQVTTVDTYAADMPSPDTEQRQGHQTQEVNLVPASDVVARVLDVPAGSDVYERARIVTRSGVPTHTMTSYYRPTDVAGTPIADPSPGIAGPRGGFAVFTDLGMEPHQITEELSARPPTSHEAEILEIGLAEPVVELHRTTRTKDGYVIEYAYGVHAASRFVWSYTFDIPD